MSEVGNIIPVPSYTVKGTTTDREILASYAGRLVQRGVTLAGGQGVLPVGTVLGRRTADKLYLVYKPGLSDGTQVPRCILRASVDTGLVASQRFFGVAIYGGHLKDNLVSAAGDATLLSTLNASRDTVNNLFKF